MFDRVNKILGATLKYKVVLQRIYCKFDNEERYPW
nr:MAG TPA: hypothetical protein [Caudoviricetes sp.]